MNEKTGIMSQVDSHYEDYGARAKELSREGKKIIGYICSFVPLEMITAAGCVPFRVRGDIREPITKGDTLMETIVCPFIRSCFDLSLKGRYEFLSGMVIPHGCDSMVRGYSAWNYSLDLPYFHFVNIPSVVKESSLEFFHAELKAYQTSLEKFIGGPITEDALSEAVTLHNRNRTKVRALYEFRKANPPILSGTELAKTLIAAASLPIEESNGLLDEMLAEMESRNGSPFKPGPRILIDGPCLDNMEVMKIIEDLGGHVVADTLCNGTRDNWPRVNENKEPVAAIADRYLAGINCPKTYRENKAGTFEGDIKARFGDIGYFARTYKVDGAVLYTYKFCDPFGFEVPARKAYYESIQVPLLYLEDLYSAGTIGQLKTRIQAFLEMME